MFPGKMGKNGTEQMAKKWSLGESEPRAFRWHSDDADHLCF